MPWRHLLPGKVCVLCIICSSQHSTSTPYSSAVHLQQTTVWCYWVSPPLPSLLLHSSHWKKECRISFIPLPGSHWHSTCLPPLPLFSFCQDWVWGYPASYWVVTWVLSRGGEGSKWSVCSTNLHLVPRLNKWMNGNWVQTLRGLMHLGLRTGPFLYQSSRWFLY